MMDTVKMTSVKQEDENDYITGNAKGTEEIH